MFGLIISGRPVNAQPEAISQTQYAFKISPTPRFSHIVLFILPGTELPTGTAASVWVQLSPNQDFRPLGGIGPGKESAIFKVSGVKPGAVPANANGDTDAMMDDDTAASAPTGDDIVVGISIEPAQQVESQIAGLKTAQAQTAPSAALVRQQSSPVASKVATVVLAQRIIGNAFNFLASFGSDTIPLKAFQAWWEKFQHKVEMDPSFLEREDAAGG
ncbi:hypothetical protein MBLNU230_g2251t1 [Neophaeotheca triangularis]